MEKMENKKKNIEDYKVYPEIDVKFKDGLLEIKTIHKGILIESDWFNTTEDKIQEHIKTFRAERGSQEMDIDKWRAIKDKRDNKG